MTKISRFRTFIILVFCVIWLAPLGGDGVSHAKRGKRKKKVFAGSFEKGRYVDSEYNFVIDIVDGWNVKVSEENKRLRFLAQKKNYASPRHFRDRELLTTVPTLKIYVDTSSLDAESFVDSLNSPTFKSKQKKAIKNEFKIYDGRSKRPRIGRVRLKSGIKGIRCKMLRKYKIEWAGFVGSLSHVSADFIQGDIVFVKRDSQLFIISGVCESLLYKGNNAPMFQKMFDSFAFSE